MLDVSATNQLIRAAKSGDNAAKERLLTENANLIKSIVRRYLNKGVEYDDLYQLAGLGLLKAINGFDESFGVRFSTYAVPMIAGEIKVSRAIKADAKAINGFVDEYSAAHGRQPTIKQIAERFAMPESQVVFTMGSQHMPVSLSSQGEYKDEATGELIDRLPSEDRQDDMIDSIQLKSAIEELDERDKKVIMLRYFRDMTQSEVAAYLGVSQVQVSRIESRILGRFKKQLAN